MGAEHYALIKQSERGKTSLLAIPGTDQQSSPPVGSIDIEPSILESGLEVALAGSFTEPHPELDRKLIAFYGGLSGHPLHLNYNSLLNDRDLRTAFEQHLPVKGDLYLVTVKFGRTERTASRLYIVRRTEGKETLYRRQLLKLEQRRQWLRGPNKVLDALLKSGIANVERVGIVRQLHRIDFPPYDGTGGFMRMTAAEGRD